MLKKYEQMAALLAMTLSLSPHSRLVLDDVNAQLSEKYGDKMGRMQRGEETVFDELFSFACPKFITPSLPDYDQPPVNYSQVVRLDPSTPLPNSHLPQLHPGMLSRHTLLVLPLQVANLTQFASGGTVKNRSTMCACVP